MEPQQPENDNPLASEPAEPVTSAPETTPRPTNPETMPETPTPASEPPSETPAATPAEAMPTTPEATPPSTSGPVTGGVVDAPINAAPVKKRRLPKAALLVVLGIALLGGAASAAYYGYVLPNKPENVLKTAIQNTLQQHQIQSVTSFTTSPTPGGSSPAVKVEANTATDLSKKTTALTLNITTSGITIPVEARLVDQNLYVKLGDLGTISQLVSGFSPEAGSLLQPLSSSLSNKWVEVDSTLLKQGGGTCFLDADWTLSNTDITYLENQYKANQFVTIKSSASDTVNGSAAEKYVLAMNDNKFADYLKHLDQVSVVKKLQQCAGKSSSLDTSSVADGDTTPVTVWVDKSTKRIVKVRMDSTAQDVKKDKMQGNLETTLKYGGVNVTAPQGAESFMQLLTELQNKYKNNPAFEAMLGSGLESL